MYAILNIPGSSHFAYHGPDTRAHCQQWLNARVEALQARGEQPSALWPQRVLANRTVKYPRSATVGFSLASMPANRRSD
jgi:hypothetical protein